MPAWENVAVLCRVVMEVPTDKIKFKQLLGELGEHFRKKEPNIQAACLESLRAVLQDQQLDLWLLEWNKQEGEWLGLRSDRGVEAVQS